ncbi:MAG TPA: ABC transporter ATP-binding protein [Anaerolineales bacterium]|jgi:ABC-2 type transport system ATP-binding protein|nr:ABC transporter ATP-binding protein [Anaerolineales bacterium]
MEEILKLHNLSKSYASFPALKNVDLELEPGRILGVLGPNGSGKTTLIKIVAGLLQPSSGEVLVCGMAPGAQTKALVSYLPDVNHLPNWMTIQGIIQYFNTFYADFDADHAAALLERMGIDQKRKVTALSRGTREKLQLSLTLARKARLYLMDELLEGIDPVARTVAIDTILDNYNPEGSLIISTHLITDVEKLLDEVVFLKDGEIILSGSTEDLRVQKKRSIEGIYKEVLS